ncbi:MAG TPA: AsmA-like C-terminal region-containing protein [Usitatibacter sp.]|nr:AsmA-like C-terminal region-containing protein [Usitatibacter sp.]
MDKTTVYTKTAKGITQVNQKSASLSKDLMKVLKLIDGKSNFGQIMEKADMDAPSLTKALNTLAKDGFARVFQVRKEEADPFAGEDDFDFTAPGKMPAATQRVVAGAANDISELVKQQEKADAARKAATASQVAATAKAKEQAEAKARAEAEARSRVEAEAKAMEQAQRAKEASERARAEVEAKMREEAARKASLAAQQAKLSAEQKAKEEEEGRKLAEARVRAEKEAKALAEARARAEAEAKAMAQARAAAEEAAKKQAAEASQADAAMKARMKEEIELRIRSEMEDLLRNEVEEKSRDEMRAQILEEAKLAAKAELEERLREERETIHKAEMEARTKAEADSRARAEKETKLRQEAEARAVAATAAAQKAQEEAQRIRAQAEAEARKLREQAEASARSAREAQARAQEEAEARAREGAEVEKRVEAERRAKYEAEARAKIEAEEADKRHRELQETIETERKAKQEAEARARIEARARETIAEDTRAKVQAEIEGDMTKRAEIEGKAQAKAYIAAKEQAEKDEDERLRAEQARKAREIADILRTKVEPDEVAPDDSPRARRGRRGRRKGLFKTIVISLVISFVVAVGLLHVIPLRNVAVKIEQSLGAWLHDDVSIASLTFRLVPTPHLRVENVAVGKLLDAKASTGRIYLDLMTLLSERVSINSIELDNVTISNEAVRRIPGWGATEGKSSVGSIATIKLRNVKMDVKPDLEPFDANLSFGKDGALQRAYLNSPNGWNVTLKPAEKGMDFEFNARHWTPQLGISKEVSDASIKGTIAGKEITVPEFEATTLEGKVNGTLHVDWTSGVKMESDLSLAKIDAKELVSNFTKDVSVTGKLDGNFSFATDGPDLASLFSNPRGQGKFHIADGSVSNVDLVAVMQSDAAGQRAGVTKFIEFNGEMSAASHNVSYKSLVFQSGVLRGNGALDIDAKSNLNGHLNLEIRSQVAQDRGVFSITGTVGRPNVKRGG